MGKKSRQKHDRRKLGQQSKALGKFHQVWEIPYPKYQRDLYTRFYMGLGGIRNHVFSKKKDQKTFDDLFEPMFENLQEMNYARTECIDLINDYIKGIKNGKCVVLEEKGRVMDQVAFDMPSIRIKKTIDMELNFYFKAFFVRGNSALECLNKLANNVLGVNLSFFFAGKDEDFEKKLESLLKKNPKAIPDWAIKDIRVHRKDWGESFKGMRNDICHDGFMLPKIAFGLNEHGRIVFSLPHFNNGSMEMVFNDLWHFVFNFCEMMVAVLLAQKLSPPGGLIIFPENMCDKTFPIKYKVGTLPKKDLSPIDVPEGQHSGILNL